MRLAHPGHRGHGSATAARLDLPVSDVYSALDTPHDDGRRRKWRKRSRARRRGGQVVVGVVALLAGILLNATVLRIGAASHPTNLVIGEKVIQRKSPSPNAAKKPLTRAAAAVSWGTPVLVDASSPLQSVSCPTSSFCAAVDAHGQAVLYVSGSWTAPQRIDGGTQINSVSCSSSSFCAAVDESGNVLYYNGSHWTAPQRIDRSAFPELTSVSCNGPTFCASVDGAGNGLVFDGARWSPPQQVDPAGWSRVSRDIATVSCPTAGFCVGVTPEDYGFFYSNGSWQPESSLIASAPVTTIKYRNPVSCPSVTFCVAAENLGQIVAYDGTQWSLPVTVDPSNYIAALSCASATFCAAVDGLLPPGFNDYSGGSSGQVFIYDGLSWSAPVQVDQFGVVTSLSCPTSTFCVAVDDSGHAVVATHTSPGR